MQYLRRFVATRVVKRWRKGVLNAAFGTWREHASEQRRLMGFTKKVLKHWKHRTIAAAFATWHAHASEQKEQKAICTRVLCHMLNRKLSIAFDTWREHVSAQKRMETVCGRIIAKMLNGKLAAAFVTWCDYAKEQRHMQDVCSRVLLKMVHRGLSVAFLTWHSNVMDFQQQLSIVEKVALRMDSLLLCRALGSWVHYIAEKRRLTMALTKTLLRMLNSKIASVFDGWASKTVTVKHQAETLCRVGRRWYHQGLATAFQAWCHHMAIVSAKDLAIRRVAALDKLTTESGQQSGWNKDKRSSRTWSLPGDDPIIRLERLGKRISPDLLERWTDLAQTRANATSGKACPRCQNGVVLSSPLAPLLEQTRELRTILKETKLTRVQNSGYVGLVVTTSSPPHAVEVLDLMDINMVKQGEPGYCNETIRPGDRILCIDGRDAQTKSLDQLHEMLRGELHSSVTLDMMRPGTERVFTVKCCRHRNHEYTIGESIMQQTHWLATTPRVSTFVGLSVGDERLPPVEQRASWAVSFDEPRGPLVRPLAITESPTRMRNSLLDDVVSPIIDVASSRSDNINRMKGTSLTEVCIRKLTLTIDAIGGTCTRVALMPHRANMCIVLASRVSSN